MEDRCNKKQLQTVAISKLESREILLIFIHLMLSSSHYLYINKKIVNNS